MDAGPGGVESAFVPNGNISLYRSSWVSAVIGTSLPLLYSLTGVSGAAVKNFGQVVGGALVWEADDPLLGAGVAAVSTAGGTPRLPSQKQQLVGGKVFYFLQIASWSESQRNMDIISWSQSSLQIARI